MSFSFFGSPDSAFYYRDYSPNSVQESTPLTLEKLGINFGLVDWNFHEPGLHAHCLYYNLDPGSSIVIKGEVVTLTPQTVVFIASGTPFEGRTAKPARHLFIEFKQTAFSRPLEGFHVLDANSRLLPLLEALYRSVASENQSEVICLALAIIHLIAIELKIQSRSLPQELSDLLVKIAKNRFRDTSTSLAQHLGYTTARFCRWFAEHLHLSPAEYIRQAQITEATRLLQSTNQSVEEIAESCGFANRFYFTRVFARAMELGPSEYRKKAAARFDFQENERSPSSTLVPFAPAGGSGLLWKSLSLVKFANRRWSGTDSWFGHFPLPLEGGKKTILGVPLRLADKNQRHQAILLRSTRIADSEGMLLPVQVVLPVEGYIQTAFILHACGWVTGTEHIADYIFSYANGKAHAEPLWTSDNDGVSSQRTKSKAGIADWFSARPPLSNAHVRPYVISGGPGRSEAVIYLLKLSNPHPKSKVRSLILRARKESPIPLAVLAVTLRVSKRR